MQAIPAGVDITELVPVPLLTVTLSVSTGAKVTLALRAEFTVREHCVLVPELAQAPPHADTAKPLVGFAVKVTLVPAGKDALQVLGQEIPPKLDVTVPEPVIVNCTVWLFVLGVTPPEPLPHPEIARFTEVNRIKPQKDNPSRD